MQEGIKDGRRLRPNGLVFYRGPESHVPVLKLRTCGGEISQITAVGGGGGGG
jgi:hypothetical protein